MVMKKQNTKGGTIKNSTINTTKAVPINMKMKGGKITMMTKGGSVKKVNMMTKGGSVKKVNMMTKGGRVKKVNMMTKGGSVKKNK